MKKLVFKCTLIVTILIVLSGCSIFNWEVERLKEKFVGDNMVIQTYDENSQLIDRIEGKSVSIEPDDRFAITDVDGEVIEKSSVLNITVGGHEMMHVGSSLIAHSAGLHNYFNDYAETVDIDNLDKSVPFINRFVNQFRNVTTGKEKIILIRSQSGTPLATFYGNKVSTFSTSIDKTTGLLIDGERLFIYRSDYTIYDVELFDK